MAAYAAVVGLMNIMEQIRNHPRLCTSFDKNQMESLGEDLDILLAFIENFSSRRGAEREVEDLERRIASAVHEAEDVIESHVVDQIHAGFAEKCPSFLIDLQKIIQDMMMRVIQEEVETKRRYKVLQPTYSPAAPSGRTTNTMVGFDDVLLQLLDRLTSESSGLQIIPIVGMGGIGKTTLARKAYQHPIVCEHFDVRAWATVSQDFNVREILFQLVSSQEEYSELQVDNDTEIDTLGALLYKHLYARKYLIILDDIWSIRAWGRIKFFFPDYGNGSRIIVTTRLSGLASHLSDTTLNINVLDESQSWRLFCDTVFPGDNCLPELEELGMAIVRNCNGLPLSIIVIGGLLRNVPMTQEHWENVAENIGSIMNSESDNRFQNILMLSYDALPPYLKPCFLYILGSFS